MSDALVPTPPPDPRPLHEVLLTIDEDARKMVEAMMDGARKFFADGDVPSAVTALDPKGIPHVYPIIHHNDMEKYCMWAFIRYLRETHPIVSMVSEIWVSHCKGDENPYKKMKPSQDPNRQEMVMITLWQGTRTVWFAADITRNPDKLGEFTVRFDTTEDGCHVEGELAKGEPYQPMSQYGQRQPGAR